MIMKEFLGKTFLKVNVVDEDSIKFVREDGQIYVMKHEQDCCESVYIEDINGDLNDLVGSPILIADESCSTNEDEVLEEGSESNGNYRDESFTWTFYRFATVKGYVDIRWYGCSNGYYSESVNIYDEGVDKAWARDIKIDNIL
jgi:hypothetical protein